MGKTTLLRILAGLDQPDGGHWAVTGVRQAKKHPSDNDKSQRGFRVNRSGWGLLVARTRA